MKTLISIAACFFSIACFGQTKLISFKSHSGNNSNFRTAVEKNLFDIGSSNFGHVMRHFDKVDTVILVGHNKIIILRKGYYVIDESDRPEYITYFRDTLTNTSSPNFFVVNSVDSLKTQLIEMYRKRYKFVKLDNTLFIGFDKKFNQKQGSLKK